MSISYSDDDGRPEISTRTSEVAVVVVGAGPSGLTVAAEVASAGLGVVVLERRRGPVPSRAGVLQPRVLELLDTRGQMDRFLAAARAWRPDHTIPGYIYAGLHGVRYDQLDSRFPYALILPQTTTEEILADWATENGALIKPGATFLGYTENEGGVEVSYVDAAGDRHTVSAQYLVGADGAKSAVRTAAGIPFDGRPTSMTAMVVDADLAFPWDESMVMKHNDAGWILTYPFGDRVTRFAIFSEARRNAPKDEPVTLEEVKAGIRAVFGEDFGIERAHWMSRYGDAHRIVPRLREGRVFLVGESARIHYPASGVGMNFCIQDGFNLGWKLAMVLSGEASDELLDTYQSERLPVAMKLLKDVDVQCAIQFNFSPEGAELKRYLEKSVIPVPDVNRQLREQLSGFATSYPAPDDAHPAVGKRIGDVPLIRTAPDDAGRLAEAQRVDRFTLLVHESQAVDEAGDLPVTIVRSGTWPDELAGLGSVLIRPDSYIAAAWTSVPDAAALRAAVAGTLRAVVTV